MTDFQRRNVHHITDMLDYRHKMMREAETEEEREKQHERYLGMRMMADTAIIMLIENTDSSTKVVHSDYKHYVGIWDDAKDRYVDYLAIYDEHKQKEGR